VALRTRPPPPRDLGVVGGQNLLGDNCGRDRRRRSFVGAGSARARRLRFEHDLASESVCAGRTRQLRQHRQADRDPEDNDDRPGQQDG
jgi:hypothetical protein